MRGGSHQCPAHGEARAAVKSASTGRRPPLLPGSFQNLLLDMSGGIPVDLAAAQPPMLSRCGPRSCRLPLRRLLGPPTALEEPWIRCKRFCETQWYASTLIVLDSFSFPLPCDLTPC